MEILDLLLGKLDGTLRTDDTYLGMKRACITKALEEEPNPASWKTMSGYSCVSGGCKTEYGLNVGQLWSMMCWGRWQAVKRHPIAWVMPVGWRRLGWSHESDFPFGDMVSPSPPFSTFDIYHVKRCSCRNLKPHCFGFHYLNPELNKLLFFITLASVRILSQQWQAD